MQTDLHLIKITRFIPMSIALFLFIIFMIGCAGLGSPFDVFNETKEPPKTEKACDPALAPVDMAALDDEEIEFLPLIPLDGNGEEEKRETSEEAAQAPTVSHNRRIQSHFDKSLEFYQASQDYWQQGELESAMDALDKAYALIVNTETAEIPKFTQQKDDLRFMISKRILEIYASRYTTVKGNHNAIPIVMNEHVKKEIEIFTKGHSRDFFINSYRRSGQYRPYILEELKKAGIPEELSWLPLIESGYKTKALSSARALGMWQFIASTGYKFGLKRDRYVDERLDPYKSTQAAIAYLKELHEIFGDWNTVLAAYNCGEGRVLREIRDQNINYLDDFWDLYTELPRETARYVPKFIATLHIINNLDKYGMGDIAPDAPVEFETVEMDKQASLADIAKAIDIEADALIALNPELRYKVLPDAAYPVKVPPRKKDVLLANIDDIQEYYQSPHNILYHRVRPGETLSTIAQRYDTTVKKIAWYNNIYRQNYIVTGQMLKIPQTGAYAARGKMGPSPRLINYTVKRGDSLWVLAKRYNTTTKKIQDVNGLNTVNLHIGQKLKIPTGGKFNFDVYHVKKGDSPISIARRHQMDLDVLLNINDLDRSCKIYPGQALYVQ